VLGTSQLWSQSGLPNGHLQILGTLHKSGTGTLDIDTTLEHSGSLLIDAGIVDLGARARFSALSRIATGAELRFSSETNVWSSGTRFEGSGTVRFPLFRSVLRLESPIDLGPLNAIFENGTRIQGEFPLTSGAGGSLSFRNGTFEIEGSLRVERQMTVALNSVVRIDDELRLASGATLDNQGRRDGQNRSNIRVRAFANQGGTILGIIPDVVPGVAPLGIRPRPTEDPPTQPRLARSRTAIASPPEWILTWEPGSRGPVGLEVSEDLITWRPLELDDATLARGYLTLPLDPGSVAAGVLPGGLSRSRSLPAAHFLPLPPGEGRGEGVSFNASVLPTSPPSGPGAPAHGTLFFRQRETEW